MMIESHFVLAIKIKFMQLVALIFNSNFITHLFEKLFIIITKLRFSCQELIIIKQVGLVRCYFMKVRILYYDLDVIKLGLDQLSFISEILVFILISLDYLEAKYKYFFELTSHSYRFMSVTGNVHNYIKFFSITVQLCRFINDLLSVHLIDEYEFNEIPIYLICILIMKGSAGFIFLLLHYYEYFVLEY